MVIDRATLIQKAGRGGRRDVETRRPGRNRDATWINSSGVGAFRIETSIRRQRLRSSSAARVAAIIDHSIRASAHP
jgi:hypothetical protein